MSRLAKGVVVNPNRNQGFQVLPGSSSVVKAKCGLDQCFVAKDMFLIRSGIDRFACTQLAVSTNR